MTGSTERPEQVAIRAVGFWAAVVALAGAIGYILSVPLQVMSVLSPTQDAVLAFVSSLAIAPSFLVAVVVLHYTVPPEKRFWTHMAVQFATIYATLACLNYVVQLAIVLPAGYSWTFTDQAGTPGPLSVLNQTPHSLMWDVDGLAYIFLNLSTLFAACAFELHGPQRVIRRVFLANASITPLFAIAYFWPHFSVPILLVGGIPWSITVPACMLALTIFFRRLPPDNAQQADAPLIGLTGRSLGSELIPDTAPPVSGGPVPVGPDFVAAAPALTDVPRIRLPPASSHRYDGRR